MEKVPSRFERVSESPHGALLRRVREQHELAQEDLGAKEFEQLDVKGKGRLRMALALTGALGMAGVSAKSVYDYQSGSQSEGEKVTVTTDTLTTEKVHDDGYLKHGATVSQSVIAPEASLRPQASPAIADTEVYSRVAQSETAVNEHESVGQTSREPEVTSQSTQDAQTDVTLSFPDIPLKSDQAMLQQLGFEVGTHKTSTAEKVGEYDVGKVVETYDSKVTSFLPATEAEWKVTLAGFKEFADVPTVGAEQYTRFEYLRDMVTFDDVVPLPIQAELRRLLPALAAQESAFKGDAVSDVGARGILQFMPETWERYTGSTDVSLSLVKQTEVAGRYLSDIYKTLDRLVGESRWAVLRQKFDSEEAFNTELVAPLILNSFNAGEGRIIELVQYYVDSKQLFDMPNGKDLFFDITQYGATADHGKYLSGYGTHSSEYVPKIEAKYTLLTKPYADTEQYALNQMNQKYN